MASRVTRTGRPTSGNSSFRWRTRRAYCGTGWRRAGTQLNATETLPRPPSSAEKITFFGATCRAARSKSHDLSGAAAAPGTAITAIGEHCLRRRAGDLRLPPAGPPRGEGDRDAAAAAPGTQRPPARSAGSAVPALPTRALTQAKTTSRPASSRFRTRGVRRWLSLPDVRRGGGDRIQAAFPAVPEAPSAPGPGLTRWPGYGSHSPEEAGQTAHRMSQRDTCAPLAA